MSPEDEDRIKALEDRIADLEAQVAPWQNVTFSDESGGGKAVIGTDNVVLCPNATTPAGSQS